MPKNSELSLHAFYKRSHNFSWNLVILLCISKGPRNQIFVSAGLAGPGGRCWRPLWFAAGAVGAVPVRSPLRYRTRWSCSPRRGSAAAAAALCPPSEPRILPPARSSPSRGCFLQQIFPPAVRCKNPVLVDWGLCFVLLLLLAFFFSLIVVLAELKNKLA